VWNASYLYYNEIFVISIAVEHGEKCEESVQCMYSNETVCRSGTCQCKVNLNFNGKRCVGNLRKYAV
jgi:hypothetical protein